MATVAQMPPRGHYLAHEVGRLAGVSGDRIGQWARRGYIRSSQSSGRPRVYSYQDVAEAIVVHELFDRNVDPRSIKATIFDLRDRYGTDWPLQHARIRVAAAHPQAKGKSRSIVISGNDVPNKDHPVFTEHDLEDILGSLASGGWAARLVPLQYIEVNPDRLSGRPTIRGRRVAAEDVARLAAEPDGRDTLREGYDLTDAEIDDAVRWWAEVQAYEAA